MRFCTAHHTVDSKRHCRLKLWNVDGIHTAAYLLRLESVPETNYYWNLCLRLTTWRNWCETPHSIVICFVFSKLLLLLLLLLIRSSSWSSSLSSCSSSSSSSSSYCCISKAATAGLKLIFHDETELTAIKLPVTAFDRLELLKINALPVVPVDHYKDTVINCPRRGYV